MRDLGRLRMSDGPRDASDSHVQDCDPEELALIDQLTEYWGAGSMVGDSDLIDL